MKFETGGELKREVEEAAGNRVGGKLGNARIGREKGASGGRFYESRVDVLLN